MSEPGTIVKALRQWHAEGPHGGGPYVLEQAITCIERLAAEVERLTRKLETAEIVRTEAVKELQHQLDEVERLTAERDALYLKLLAEDGWWITSNTRPSDRGGSR